MPGFLRLLTHLAVAMALATVSPLAGHDPAKVASKHFNGYSTQDTLGRACVITADVCVWLSRAC